ncbi:PilZ domain-containing protein [Devosia rhizoryzae]|uniref:PilZ domain-containing protein n=1 Tax=Devosia rhizoryzae TaxID=2774137 RepID=A0ABX7C1Q6_9HYPH|nr:PilZ domain-containing protein [Devosia rhizoryzae]QQR38165.1 PilZ domain-containing protein [Devosia rhizoryzae]
MNEDTRSSQRHRTLKGGKIVVNDGFSTFSCTVRNMSETGAKLLVPSVIGIPERFSLALDDGRSFACEVAWRTETELGVRFS